MKKVVSLIFTFLMLFSFVLSVNAEKFNGADLFIVDLPDDFEQTGANVTDYTFTNKDGDSFAINYCDNSIEGEIFSPADMSKKDIQTYTDSISEESKVVMKEFAEDFDIKFLSGEKVKHKNGKTALVCKTKTTITKNKKTVVYYQTMYEFGGVDYKYTFTHTTDDEKNKDSFKAVFDSIEIFEGETESNLDKAATIAVAGIMVLLVIAGIIRFIRTPEKRAQGKLK